MYRKGRACFARKRPRWLFLWPGLALILAGLIALPGLAIYGIHFDAHTLLFASLFILCGFQALLFAIFARTIAMTQGTLPPNRNLLTFYELINLEKGLAASAVALLAGFCLLFSSINEWRMAHLGGWTMRIRCGW